MSVGYGAIRESFTSRVTLRPRTDEIDVVNLDGPFAHLDNRWRFRDVPGGSEVHFYIDYAFRSRMLALVDGRSLRQGGAQVHARRSRRAPAPSMAAHRRRLPSGLADRLADVAGAGEARRTVSSPRTPVRMAPSRSASLRSAPVRSAPVEIGVRQVGACLQHGAGEVGPAQVGEREQR